jgi:hypothetical protein
MRHFVRLSIAASLMLAASPVTAFAQGEAVAPRQLQLVKTPSRAGTTPSTEAQRTAYLLSYFKDETHSLYFATSRDGYSFTDVNSGEPVLAGAAIAEQKGIRDPHLMRGPDGAFYLTLTDLHIFAQREGLRSTEWERPGEQYSWGNNRNMIFMKSYDLINWTHARVTIDKLFPAFANAGCSWAPETIYDPVAKKMMVYFTTRLGNGPNFMVYSYANAAFDTLTAKPEILFNYPKPNVNTIDADITKVGDKYQMFYVAHDNPGGLRWAQSDRINAGYSYDPRPVTSEKAASEAPHLWRRHGTNRYVLMYDVFGIKPNNMGFTETTDFKTFRPLGRFNDAGSPMKATNFSSPKHGSVTPITVAEAERLEKYFAARR